MTCSGCKSAVEDKLSDLADVNHVEADVDTAQTKIETRQDVDFDTLAKQLDGSGYSLCKTQKEAQTFTYYVKGMSCSGCEDTVKSSLETLEDITDVSTNIKKGTVRLRQRKPVSFFKLKKALKDTHYTLFKDKESAEKANNSSSTPKDETGVFYCPMMCEGDKTYDHMRDCPVCGMDLVEQVSAAIPTVQWTCPDHPEVIQDSPGNCSICGKELVEKAPEMSAEELNYKKLERKFIASIAFTLPIFIIAMSGMLPQNPLYNLMPLKYWNWVQFALSLPVVFYFCWMFFERAWRSLKTWNLNMFTLIGIGSGVAWTFSLCGLLFPQFFPTQFKASEDTVHVYFEATTVILTLVLLGQLLEARAHRKTSNAVKELLKLAPSKATKLVNGEEISVALQDVKKGDILRVKPGDKIPVDGKITQGESSIDASMITGEPIPVEKKPEDEVSAGTINGSGSFLMQAEKVGNETLLAQIIEMVNTASRSQAPIQKLADKISSYFVPTVVGISIITFILWAIFGPSPAYVFAFVNAIAVLIIACPCALGLATPMSVMVGIGKGAQHGVLIKDAEALEILNQIDTLVIDKTGTLTEGKPSVNQVTSVNNQFGQELVLQYMTSLNAMSEHPLAQAVLNEAKKNNTSPLPVNHFKNISGKGVVGEINGQHICLGNDKLMQMESVNILSPFFEDVQALRAQGKTVSFLSVNRELAGYIVIEDKIKSHAKEAIDNLRKKGIDVVMLTGDNTLTAQAVAKEVGIEHFKAEMLPQDKLKEVEKQQKQGKKVAVAGDGINDAPALAQANVGIAMGTGTDIAIQSAEVTLVKGDLHGIARALNLGQATMRNIKQNLFFALGYNSIGIPIAAGVLFPFFGILLSPMLAAVAMSFSSVSVITNALRLRRISLN